MWNRVSQGGGSDDNNTDKRPHRRGSESIVSSSSRRHPSRTSSNPSSGYAQASQGAFSESVESMGEHRSSRDSRESRRDRSRSRETERSHGKKRRSRSIESMKSSGSHRHHHRRHRSQSSDEEDRKRDRRDRKKSESEKDRGSSRAGPDIVEVSASGTYETHAGSSSDRPFTQFPGQTEVSSSSLPGAFPEDNNTTHYNSHPENFSSHVPDQFPGQFPAHASQPYQPPKSSTEGGAGLAAEYYGDQGQSVAHQPGVRPHKPSLIVGAEPHLMAASPISAPPVEPSASGGVGAAASFFEDSGAPVDVGSSSGNRPSKPGRKPSRTSSGSGGVGALAGGAALGYAASQLYDGSSSKPSKPSKHSKPGKHSSTAGSAYGVTESTGSTVYYDADTSVNYTQGAQGSGHHSSSVLPALGVAAAGATAGYLASHYQDGHHNADGDVSPGYISASHERPSKHGKHSHSHSHTHSHSQSQSHGHSSSNAGLYAGAALGAAGLAAAGHHHNSHSHGHGHQSGYSSSSTTGLATRRKRRGPGTRFADFFRDPDGVGQFEEYTRIIGVCRDCFEPGSSPADAPRKHHYHRRGRRSTEKLGSYGRIGKENRYYSSDGASRKHKNNGSSWLATGLAGYGLGKVGKTLFNTNRDFDDTYSVRTGHVGNDSSVSVHHHHRHSSSHHHSKHRSRSRSGSRGRHRAEGALLGAGITSSIVGRGRSRSRSRNRVEKGITADGKLYKKESAGGFFGGPKTTYYEDVGGSSHKHRRRSRSSSSSRSRSRSRRRVEKGITADGKLYKKDSQGGFFGGSKTTIYEDVEGRHRRHSRSRSRSRNRHSTLIGAAIGAGLGASAANSHSHSRRRSRSRSSSAGHKHKSRSSQSGFLGGFFSAPSENRHRKVHAKSKKRKGFFSFSNGSSSSASTDFDLAFGGSASSIRRQSKAERKKEKESKSTDAALMGIAAGLGALAGNDARKGSKLGKDRRAEVIAVKEASDRYGSDRRHSKKSHRHRHSSASSHEDQDWESASEDEGSIDSALAFGSSLTRKSSKGKSTESLVSNNSGTGKWWWRWGGSKSKRREDSPSRLAGAAAAGLAGAAAGAAFGGRPGYDPRFDTAASSMSSLPSMHSVQPIPTSDPNNFDAARRGQSSSTYRPAPVPIQQPQPLPSVDPAIYQTQQLPNTYGAPPTGPPVFAGPLVQYRDQQSQPTDSFDASRQHAIVGDFKDDSYVRRDVHREKPKRRSSSPTFIPADLELETAVSAKLHKESSRRDEDDGIVDLRKRSDKSTDDLSRESKKESSKRRKAEEKAAAEAAREKARSERKRSKSDASESKRSSKRDTAPVVVEQKESESSWVEPVAAGAFGAVVGAAVAGGKRSKDKEYHSKSKDREIKDESERKSHKKTYRPDDTVEIVQELDRRADIARKAASKVIADRPYYSDEDDMPPTSILDKYNDKPIDMASYWRPAELSYDHKANEEAKREHRKMDTDVIAYDVPQIITVEPDKSSTSFEAYGVPREQMDPSRIGYQAAPSLKVIPPTPPGSKPASVIGDSSATSSPDIRPVDFGKGAEAEIPDSAVSPRDQRKMSNQAFEAADRSRDVPYPMDPVDSRVVEEADRYGDRRDEDSRKPAVGSRVSWGPDETRIFHQHDESPSDSREDFIANQSPSPPLERKRQDSRDIKRREAERDQSPPRRRSPQDEKDGRNGRSSQRDRKVEFETARDDPVKQMPGSFGQDIDLAATMAAGLEASGFDPNLVTKDPKYHKRESPPGSDEEMDKYRRRGASETATTESPRYEIKRTSKHDDESSSRHQSSTPIVEDSLESMIQNDMDQAIEEQKKVSKKDKRKAKKKAKSSRESSIVEEEATDPVIEPDSYSNKFSTRSDSIVEEPDTYERDESTEKSGRRHRAESSSDSRAPVVAGAAMATAAAAAFAASKEGHESRSSRHRRDSDDMFEDAQEYDGQYDTRRDVPYEDRSSKYTNGSRHEQSGKSEEEEYAPERRHHHSRDSVSQDPEYTRSYEAEQGFTTNERTSKTSGSREARSDIGRYHSPERESRSVVSDMNKEEYESKQRHKPRSHKNDQDEDEEEDNDLELQPTISSEQGQDQEGSRKHRKKHRHESRDETSDLPTPSAMDEDDDFDMRSTVSGEPEERRKHRKKHRHESRDDTNDLPTPTVEEEDDDDDFDMRSTVSGGTEERRKHRKKHRHESRDDTSEPPTPSVADDDESRRKKKSKDKDAEKGKSSGVFSGLFGKSADNLLDPNRGKEKGRSRSRSRSRDRRGEEEEDEDRKKKHRHSRDREDSTSFYSAPSEASRTTESFASLSRTDSRDDEGGHKHRRHGSTKRSDDGEKKHKHHHRRSSIRSNDDEQSFLGEGSEGTPELSDSAPASPRAKPSEPSLLSESTSSQQADARSVSVFDFQEKAETAIPAADRRMSSIQTADSTPSSATRVASPTAVPILFKRPPPSPGYSRTVSHGSTPSTPGAAQPRQSRSRPNSTEFRPLFLVEQHRSRSEPTLEESYPSLPSSRTTSRSPSEHDPEEFTAAEDEHAQALAALEHDSLGKDLDLEGHRKELSEAYHDTLGSSESTPKASTFAHDGSVPSSLRQDRPVFEVPRAVQSSQAEETPQVQFEYKYNVTPPRSPNRLTHSVSDLFPPHKPEQASSHPTTSTDDLPPLPRSRTTSLSEYSRADTEKTNPFDFLDTEQQDLRLGLADLHQQLTRKPSRDYAASREVGAPKSIETYLDKDQPEPSLKPPAAERSSTPPTVNVETAPEQVAENEDDFTEFKSSKKKSKKGKQKASKTLSLYQPSIESVSDIALPSKGRSEKSSLPAKEDEDATMEEPAAQDTRSVLESKLESTSVPIESEEPTKKSKKDKKKKKRESAKLDLSEDIAEPDTGTETAIDRAKPAFDTRRLDDSDLPPLPLSQATTRSEDPSKLDVESSEAPPDIWSYRSHSPDAAAPSKASDQTDKRSASPEPESTEPGSAAIEEPESYPLLSRKPSKKDKKSKKKEEREKEAKGKSDKKAAAAAADSFEPEPEVEPTEDSRSGRSVDREENETSQRSRSSSKPKLSLAEKAGAAAFAGVAAALVAGSKSSKDDLDRGEEPPGVSTHQDKDDSEDRQIEPAVETSKMELDEAEPQQPEFELEDEPPTLSRKASKKEKKKAKKNKELESLETGSPQDEPFETKPEEVESQKPAPDTVDLLPVLSRKASKKEKKKSKKSKAVEDFDVNTPDLESSAPEPMEVDVPEESSRSLITAEDSEPAVSTTASSERAHPLFHHDGRIWGTGVLRADPDSYVPTQAADVDQRTFEESVQETRALQPSPRLSDTASSLAPVLLAPGLDLADTIDRDQPVTDKSVDREIADEVSQEPAFEESAATEAPNEPEFTFTSSKKSKKKDKKSKKKGLFESVPEEVRTEIDDDSVAMTKEDQSVFDENVEAEPKVIVPPAAPLEPLASFAQSSKSGLSSHPDIDPSFTEEAGSSKDLDLEEANNAFTPLSRKQSKKDKKKAKKSKSKSMDDAEEPPQEDSQLVGAVEQPSTTETIVQAQDNVEDLPAMDPTDILSPRMQAGESEDNSIGFFAPVAQVSSRDQVEEPEVEAEPNAEYFVSSKKKKKDKKKKGKAALALEDEPQEKIVEAMNPQERSLDNDLTKQAVLVDEATKDLEVPTDTVVEPEAEAEPESASTSKSRKKDKKDKKKKRKETLDLSGTATPTTEPSTQAATPMHLSDDEHPEPARTAEATSRDMMSDMIAEPEAPETEHTESMPRIEDFGRFDLRPTEQDDSQAMQLDEEREDFDDSKYYENPQRSPTLFLDDSTGIAHDSVEELTKQVKSAEPAKEPSLKTIKEDEVPSSAPTVGYSMPGSFWDEPEDISSLKAIDRNEPMPTEDEPQPGPEPEQEFVLKKSKKDKKKSKAKGLSFDEPEQLPSPATEIDQDAQTPAQDEPEPEPEPEFVVRKSKKDKKKSKMLSLDDSEELSAPNTSLDRDEPTPVQDRPEPEPEFAVKKSKKDKKKSKVMSSDDTEELPINTAIDQDESLPPQDEAEVETEFVTKKSKKDKKKGKKSRQSSQDAVTILQGGGEQDLEPTRQVGSPLPTVEKTPETYVSSSQIESVPHSTSRDLPSKESIDLVSAHPEPQYPQSSSEPPKDVRQDNLVDSITQALETQFAMYGQPQLTGQMASHEGQSSPPIGVGASPKALDSTPPDRDEEAHFPQSSSGSRAPEEVVDKGEIYRDLDPTDVSSLHKSKASPSLKEITEGSWNFDALDDEKQDDAPIHNREVTKSPEIEESTESSTTTKEPAPEESGDYSLSRKLSKKDKKKAKKNKSLFEEDVAPLVDSRELLQDVRKEEKQDDLTDPSLAGTSTKEPIEAPEDDGWAFKPAKSKGKKSKGKKSGQATPQEEAPLDKILLRADVLGAAAAISASPEKETEEEPGAEQTKEVADAGEWSFEPLSRKKSKKNKKEKKNESDNSASASKDASSAPSPRLIPEKDDFGLQRVEPLTDVSEVFSAKAGKGRALDTEEIKSVDHADIPQKRDREFDSPVAQAEEEKEDDGFEIKGSKKRKKDKKEKKSKSGKKKEKGGAQEDQDMPDEPAPLATDGDTMGIKKENSDGLERSAPLEMFPSSPKSPGIAALSHGNNAAKMRESSVTPKAAQATTPRALPRDSGIHDMDDRPSARTSEIHPIAEEEASIDMPTPISLDERDVSTPKPSESRASLHSNEPTRQSAGSIDPLEVSVEMDPMYDVSVSRPEDTDTESVEIKWRPDEEGSGQRSMAESTEELSRSIKPARSMEDMPPPSPVDSTSKERSSLLFKSSPGHKHSESRDTNDSVDSQDYDRDITEPSKAAKNLDLSSNKRASLLPGAINVKERDGRDMFKPSPPEDREVAENRERSLAALTGTAAIGAATATAVTSTKSDDAPYKSIFGGSAKDLERPRTPTSTGFSERRRLDPITEDSPQEESPLARKGRHTQHEVSPRPAKTLRRAGAPLEDSHASHRDNELDVPRKRDRSGASPENESVLSTEDLISRLSWPAVDENEHTVDLNKKRSREHRGLSPTSASLATSAGQKRAASGGSDRSAGSAKRIITPDHDTLRPGSVLSNRSGSTGTPPLRRVDRRLSGDLRAASRLSEAPPTSQKGKAPSLAKQLPQQQQEDLSNIASSSTYDPVKDKGKARVVAQDMADVYEAWGEHHGSPMSPTRPHSVVRKQSIQLLDMENRLNSLISENRLLVDGKARAEQELQQSRGFADELASRDSQIRDRDDELDRLKGTLEWLQREVTRLTDTNERLTATTTALAATHNERYNALQESHTQLQQSHDEKHEQLVVTSRELGQVATGRENIESTLVEKDREIEELREELQSAQAQIRELQKQILASNSTDNLLVIRDEDYFDSAFQRLFSNVQQWVMRFSKFSDMEPARLLNELGEEDWAAESFDNAIIDGTDVDDYLVDRKKRRDVFMSVVMTMINEHVFTRYLFGMDREQRHKLKSVEQNLAEVGPSSAVNKWRATTLALLTRRPTFATSRDKDIKDVANAIYSTLATVLPPPKDLEGQIQESLRKVLRSAVDLSIEMRTQKATFIMLPPLQPGYDINGDIERKVPFNASLMNNRSGSTASDEELESQGAIVQMVLFPPVVKDGDEETGNDRVVVRPAQVLVAPSAKDKKVVRIASGSAMDIDSGPRGSSTTLGQTDGGMI